jgi:hypothetical protein
MEWAFIHRNTPAGRNWSWRHTAPDGTVRTSSSSFPTLTDCQRDAVKNGLTSDIASQITFKVE